MSLRALLNETCTIGAADVPCRIRLRNYHERKFSNPAYQDATCAIYVEDKNYKEEKYLILNGKKFNILGSLELGGQTKIRCLYVRQRARLGEENE